MIQRRSQPRAWSRPTSDLSPWALLSFVAQTHPGLTAAAAAIAEPRGMTLHWWKQFQKVPGHPRAKALVLRAFLGDATIRRAVPPPVTADGLERIAQYLLTCPGLQELPREPRSVGGRPAFEAFPSRLRALCQEASANDPVRFMAALVVRPAWQRCLGTSPASGPFAHLSVYDLHVLDPFLEARYLRLAEMERVLGTTSRIPPSWFAWYFDTGIRPLDVRNLILFCARVLGGDREGGRIQNVLPLQLRCLGLPARSVPETLAALDVIHLAIAGVIDPRKLSREEDFMGLQDLLTEQVPYPNFWREVVPDVTRLVVLNRERAARYTAPESTYDTGLLFHPARLVGLLPGKAARLARFRPYYAAVDDQALRAMLSPHLLPEVAQILNQARAVAPELLVGIRLRGTANILQRLFASGEDLASAAIALPSVARFALGEAEPVPSQRPSRSDERSTRRAAAPPPRRPPPLLVKLGLVPPDARQVKPRP